MANVQYSGVRESKLGRVNDLGTTGKKVEENFRKGCLKRADRSFAQGLQCQQINSMAALMSLEDSVFISHSCRTGSQRNQEYQESKSYCNEYRSEKRCIRRRSETS